MRFAVIFHYVPICGRFMTVFRRRGRKEPHFTDNNLDAHRYLCAISEFPIFMFWAKWFFEQTSAVSLGFIQQELQRYPFLLSIGVLFLKSSISFATAIIQRHIMMCAYWNFYLFQQDDLTYNNASINRNISVLLWLLLVTHWCVFISGVLQYYS